MDRPPADPAKLLHSLSEWEQGEITPGRAMADLKTGGLRDVLDHLASTDAAASSLLAAWMPWEQGTAAPGDVLVALHEAGLRAVLQGLVPAGS